MSREKVAKIIWMIQHNNRVRKKMKNKSKKNRKTKTQKVETKLNEEKGKKIRKQIQV